jgi:MoaA/NifB/PqqE/SkfB family radical SAM enzyme
VGGNTLIPAELESAMRSKTIASLFLLPQCDMSCRFCASEQDFSVMTFEQAVVLLQELRARSIRNVVLGGGEPFLWPHGLERLSRVASELGFLVQVCTNGVSLPEGFEQIRTIDRYLLPLESMDPERHNLLRRYKNGHHAIALERIRKLAGSGRELTVSTVLTRENLDQLPALANHLSEAFRDGVAIHAWHLYRFLPVGRGGTPNAEDLGITHEAFLRVSAEIKRLPLGFPVFRRDNMLRSSSVEFFWFERGKLRIGCRDAK